MAKVAFKVEKLSVSSLSGKAARYGNGTRIQVGDWQVWFVEYRLPTPKAMRIAGHGCRDAALARAYDELDKGYARVEDFYLVEVVA